MDPSQLFYEGWLQNKDTTKTLILYKTLMSRIALIFAFKANREVSREDILKEVEEVMDFEEKLNLVKSIHVPNVPLCMIKYILILQSHTLNPFRSNQLDLEEITPRRHKTS